MPITADEPVAVSFLIVPGLGGHGEQAYGAHSAFLSRPCLQVAEFL